MGVEDILVHVSGPSSGKDDRRFREIAFAYERFEHSRTFELTSGAVSKQDHGRVSRAAPVPSSDVAQDAQDTESSVIVARTKSVTKIRQAHEISSHTPMRPVEYIEDTPQAVAALESQLLTSSLAVSPSPLALSRNDMSPFVQRLPQNRGISCNAISQSVSFHTPGPVNPSAEESSASELADSFPALDSEDLSELDAHAQSQIPVILQSSPPEAEANTGLGIVPRMPNGSIDFSFTPDITEPPFPPVSDKLAPNSCITRALRLLADQLDLSKTYQPEFQSRELSGDERGYWRIDTSVWAPDTQADFWAELRTLVVSGQAGYKVWCCRDPDWTKKVSEEEKRSTLGVVMLFCCGEVIGHVYLLAFLASKSRIKWTRAQWVDAGGQVIVQMP